MTGHNFFCTLLIKEIVEKMPATAQVSFLKAKGNGRENDDEHLNGRKEMEKFMQITRYPAGRIGLTIGLVVGFGAAFIGEARRMFFLIGVFVGLIAFWQHAFFSGARPEFPPSLLKR